MGYSFTNLLSPNPHIISTIAQTSRNIAKLYRFRSAPVKIKRYLYITLIRPLLEYPCIELNKTTRTNKSKLQKIQNKALRFILNLRLNDRVRAETMHERAKLDPINVRLAKLTRKMLYKMKDLYVDANEDIDLAPYARLAIEYEIEQNPIRPRKPSMCEVLRDIICIYDRPPAVFTLPEDMEDFIIPPPIFL